MSFSDSEDIEIACSYHEFIERIESWPKFANPFMKFAAYLLMNPKYNKFAIHTPKGSKIFISSFSDLQDYSLNGLTQWRTQQLKKFYQFLTEISPEVSELQQIQIAQAKEDQLHEFDIEHYQGMLLFKLIHQHKPIKVIQEIFAEIGNREIALGGLIALLLAASGGNLNAVKYFVEAGVNIEAREKDGATSLYIASQNGYLEIVQYLVDKRANIEAIEKDGATPLYIASQNGCLEIVQYLVSKGAEIEVAQKDGATPLFIASQKGYLEIVKCLADSGAKLDVMREGGITSLYIASQNGHLAVVQYLVDNGANIESAEIDGVTSLLIAAYMGHIEVVQYLVDKGARIDAAEKDGITPLYIASQNGHLAIVQYLVNEGASIESAEIDGATSLYIASQNGHTEIVKYLVGMGAEIDAAEKDGITPLYAASQNGHLEIVQYLVSSGAKIEARQKYGATPLYIASQNGHLEIVQYLVDNGANVEAAQKNGFASLLIASQDGHVEIVKYLISKGAKIETAEIDGATSLYIASENGHLVVVKLLLSSGANTEVKFGGYTIMEAIIPDAILIKGEISLFKADPIKYVLENNEDANSQQKALEALSKQSHFLHLHDQLGKVIVTIECAKILEELITSIAVSNELSDFYDDRDEWKSVDSEVAIEESKAWNILISNHENAAALAIDRVSISSKIYSTTTPLSSVLNNIAAGVSVHSFVSGGPNNLWRLLLEDIEDSINQALEGKSNPKDNIPMLEDSSKSSSSS